jgi:hypothetical protein
MKGDFSRRIFDAHNHYAGVLHQQGRVWLDSDWNEDVFERLNLLQQETRDIVGPCGVPEPGTAFLISQNPRRLAERARRFSDRRRSRGARTRLRGRHYVPV